MFTAVVESGVVGRGYTADRGDVGSEGVENGAGSHFLDDRESMKQSLLGRRGKILCECCASL